MEENTKDEKKTDRKFSLLTPVLGSLRTKGIVVDPNTAKVHDNQGWMSTVFTVQSNRGKLIVHEADLVSEHMRHEVWDKFAGIAAILAAHPEIPAPAMHFTGFVDGKLMLVQDYKEGVPAGKRFMKDGVITDEWSADKLETAKRILTALASVHKIGLQGFGWPILKDNKLQGPYSSWKGFFETESPHWIEEINKADQRLGREPISNLTEFTKSQIGKIDHSGPSVLVHGDAINPSNILLDGEKLSLLDWEWAIAADPAWEFCDLGWWELLDKLDISAEVVKRAKLYAPLWLIWGAHLHAEDQNSEVYLDLRKLLLERM